MAMRRFQMMLDPELDAALERRAETEGVSKAELLRRYARERLSPLPELHADPIWQMVGVDDRADDDGAAVDIDEVVYDAGRPR
jgi:Ribbon-helix-helix protein, copG family